MGKSPIEWLYRGDEAGHTINPIRFRANETGRVGHYCEKISPGCKFCYSSEMQRGPYLSGLEFLAANRDKGELFLDRNALNQVMRRRKPTTYFWCDMTDLFLVHHPFTWIEECFGVMLDTPQHRHMVLTKRDQRMREYFESEPARAELMAGHDIWLGVSVEDRERKGRLETLRKIPAPHRFASFEPLLEDLALQHDEVKGIDLAIFGGESGPHARPCRIEWIRHAMAVAKSARSMVFVKQVGKRPVDRNNAGVDAAFKNRAWPEGTRFTELADGRQGAPVLVQIKDAKGGDMAEWPPALRVRELPRC